MKNGLLSAAMTCLVVAGFALVPAQRAEAGLLGDTVTGEVQFGGTTAQGPANAVVGAGVEFDFPNVDIDLGDLTIRFFNIAGGTVTLDETYLLTDLDFGGPSLVGFASSFQNLSTAPVFAFTSNSFSATLPSGTNVSSGAEINIRLTTVPEPGTLALLGLGLAGLAASRRRKR